MLYTFNFWREYSNVLKYEIFNECRKYFFICRRDEDVLLYIGDKDVVHIQFLKRIFENLGI